MKKFKRLLSCLMTVIILFSSVPFAGLYVKGEDSIQSLSSADTLNITNELYKIALADMYTGRINGHGWMNYYFLTSNFQGTYRIMSEALKNDAAHNLAVNGWDFIDGLGSSYEWVKENPHYYYEISILNLLKQNSESKTTVDSVYNDTNAVIITIGEHFAESLKIDYKELANTAPNAVLSDCYNDIAEIYNIDLNTIKAISTATDVVTNIADFAEKLGMYISLRDMSDSTLTVLSQMADFAETAAMKRALNEIVENCSSNMDDFIFECVMDFADMSIGYAAGMLVDAMIDFSGKWMLDLGISFGQLTSDLLCNTSEVITQYKNMCVVVEFENALRKAVKNLKTTYIDMPNIDNADNVIAAADLVYDVIYYGMDVANDYSTVIYTNNYSKLIGSVCDFLNLNDDGFEEWTKSWFELRGEIEKSENYFRKEMVTTWIYDYWWEYSEDFTVDVSIPNGDSTEAPETPEENPDYSAIDMNTITIYPNGTYSVGEKITNGEGTKYFPYRIRTEDDLSLLASSSSGKIYHLMNNITVSADNWTPIKDFGGTLNGYDFVIDGITIKTAVSTSANIGLFANINSNGTVRNLGITNFNSTANTSGNIGALAGQNSGIIEYCYATGKIENASPGNIGGLVGNSYAYPINASISNSYTDVEIISTGKTGYVGGIIGNTSNYSNYINYIKNCYAIGEIEAYTSNAGGIIGYLSSYTTIVNCFYDKDTVGKNDVGNGFSISTDEMKKEITFGGWDFENVWDIDSSVNNGYPYLRSNAKMILWIEGAGTEVSPYIITNEDQLYGIEFLAYDKSKTAHYVLGNNIKITSPYWEPISDFGGVFDGNGYVIDGITFSQYTGSNMGLFTNINSNGTVRNLGITNFNSTANTSGNIGALAGQNSGIIEYCYATGKIENASPGNIGGLVGNSYAYPINASISNSYTDVEIISTGKTGYVGGIIGNTSNYSNYINYIKNCYAIGEIEAYTSNAGGIIGYLSSYTTIVNCFYDKDTTGRTDNNGTPLTSVLMKMSDSYDGWDFQNIWGINKYYNNGYPYLLVHTYAEKEPETYIIDRGYCGDNAEWKFTSDGLLTISGSGKTDNYTTPYMAPWYKYADDITSVYVTNGITKIGNFNFYALKNIEIVKADNANLSFGLYTFVPSSNPVFYGKGAGELEKFTKENGYKLVKPVNPYTVVAPQLFQNTANSITLRYKEGYEYSMDGKNWCSSNVFTGLKLNTKYSFYQRIAEGTYRVSDVSSVAYFSTSDKIEKPVVINISKNRVTLKAVAGYEYSLNGSEWQSGNVFENLAYNTEYVIYQRVAATSQYAASDISEGIYCKLSSLPLIRLIGSTKALLNLPEGYEWSLDGVYWQKDNEFSLLLPETDYIIYQRNLIDNEKVYIVGGFNTNGQDNTDTTPNAENLVDLRQALLSEENNMVFNYNGDDTVDIRDLVRLKKFLAGVDVPLGTAETAELLLQPAYIEQKNIAY